MAGCCERGNEHVVCTKYWEYHGPAGELVGFKGLREISDNSGRFPFYGILLTKRRESLSRPDTPDRPYVLTSSSLTLSR